jgi:hypothetical protein
MSKQPRFPTGGRYNHLVDAVSCYGLGLGAALATPDITFSTYTRWFRYSREEREPYRSWCKQFGADVQKALDRVERIRRGEEVPVEEMRWN